MKANRKIKTTSLFTIGLIILYSFSFVACSKSEAENLELNNSDSLSSTKIALIDDEIRGLIFMREEEKLARDVYLTFNNLWNQRVFENISESEQRHMDALKIILDNYGITDPVSTDSVGVFTNTTLQELYDTLIEQGSANLIDALKAGALIEEIDILDLRKELDENVSSDDLRIVYENLLRGSRNHLRAFNRNLAAEGIEYIPQKLPLEDFNEIINSEWEKGSASCNR